LSPCKSSSSKLNDLTKKKNKSDKADGESNLEIDLKRARQEVHRFGIKGLEQTDKQAAVLEMLIKLGAKAPKKQYVNYKELIVAKKAEKEKLQSKKSSGIYDQGKLEAIRSLNLFKKKIAKKKKGKASTDGRPADGSAVRKIRGRDIAKIGRASKNERKEKTRKEKNKRPSKTR